MAIRGPEFSLSGVATILIGGVLVVSTALAAPPLEYKGLRIGSATMAEWQERFPAYNCGEKVCSFSPSAFTEQCLREVMRAGGDGGADDITACQKKAEPYQYGLYHPRFTVASFMDDKLVQVSMTVAPDDLNDYVEAITAKYGAPRVSRRPMQNLMGARFEDRIYKWTLSNGDIVAEKYVGNINDASIMLMGVRLRDTPTPKNQAKEAAKNL